MSNINWLELLDWGKQEINDISYVGYSYLKQGCYDVALKFYQTLTVLEPQNSYFHQTLGAIFLQTGKNLEALEHLDRALRLQPKDYPSMLNRAKALFTLGYKKQGIMQAQKLIACQNPEIASQARTLIETYF